MMRPILAAVILLLAMPSGFTFPVRPGGEAPAAGSPLVASQDSEERKPGPANLEEAIEIAVKRYGGRAVDADTVVRDGKTVHEIRLLDEEDENSVRTVRIDPQTGAIIPPPRR